MARRGMRTSDGAQPVVILLSGRHTLVTALSRPRVRFAALHAGDECLHLLAHASIRQVRALSVSREQPIKAQLAQPTHRRGLFFPRVPADLARGVESSDPSTPPHMVTAEERTVIAQQALRPGGVARQ